MLVSVLCPDFHSASQSQPPPTHLQTATTYDSTSQPEPLLSLLTSQHPLAASLINGSLSAYRSTQAYIPGAYFVEQNVGLPIAGTIGRVTGVEGGIRWALQSRRDGSYPGHSQSAPGDANMRQDHDSTPNIVDIEKGLVDGYQTRTGSEMSLAEPLPEYDEGGRSPPYQEQQQLAYQPRHGQAPSGWRTQLMISTSGLGVAMSEESLRSLRYCLSWLRWANGRLGGAIDGLKDVLRAWEVDKEQRVDQVQTGNEVVEQRNRSQAAFTARIAALKTDVLQTLKQVVGIVSNYAGGALPENARNLVHRHLTSLPQRFSIASAMSSRNKNRGEAASSAHHVMVLAQEGLDMMSQVSCVVNNTLVSAESWCEKLGRRKGQDEREKNLSAIAAAATATDAAHVDAKMEM